MAPAIKRPAPRAAKLDALVNILSASKAPVTAAALAKSLKVSERTVYRYVSELVGQGMQIQGGAGFGYVFWPAVDAWSITLTGKEAQAVLFGLKVAEMPGLFNANDFVICFGAISWNWTIPSGRFV